MGLGLPNCFFFFFRVEVKGLGSGRWVIIYSQLLLFLSGWK
jgi:hypothetical protein